MSNKTGKNFIGVSITIFFSKLLGFVREIVFASVFGTTVLTDMFQVIFSFPSLFFSSIGTALSAVNIPDLTYFITHRSKEERNQYLANLFAQVTFIASTVALLGIVCAPPLTQIIAPGLSPKVDHIAVLLTRIMMPTLLFVSLTYLTAGVLQVHQYFLVSASISIPFNMLIIWALLWKGNDLVFLGYVTTLGWLLQFLIQLPVLVREKYQWRFKLQWSDPYIRNTFKNLLPILLGNSLLQLCLIIDRSFATHLSPGTAASLAFGSNLFVTITSVFIVAMTTVVFPRLSRYCLDSDFERIRFLLAQAFKMLLFILVPYLLLVICYHKEIITLVYQRGADFFGLLVLQFSRSGLSLPGGLQPGLLCFEALQNTYVLQRRLYTAQPGAGLFPISPCGHWGLEPFHRSHHAVLCLSYVGYAYPGNRGFHQPRSAHIPFQAAVSFPGHAGGGMGLCFHGLGHIRG
jgi:putative peptidoglycan lipid II flippase